MLVTGMHILGYLFSLLTILSVVSSSSAFDYWLSNQYPLPRNEEPLSTDLSDIIAASPLLALHRALCEVESITNNENAVGKLLVSYLEAHNFTVTAQEVPQPQPHSPTSKKPRYNIFALPRSPHGDKQSRKSGPG